MVDGELKERLKNLCARIVKEQDHQRFSALLAELDQLLDGSGLTKKKSRPSPSDKSPV